LFLAEPRFLYLIKLFKTNNLLLNFNIKKGFEYDNLARNLKNLMLNDLNSLKPINILKWDVNFIK
jgi:hypothetical protein